MIKFIFSILCLLLSGCNKGIASERVRQQINLAAASLRTASNTKASEDHVKQDTQNTQPKDKNFQSKEAEDFSRCRPKKEELLSYYGIEFEVREEKALHSNLVIGREDKEYKLPNGVTIKKVLFKENDEVTVYYPELFGFADIAQQSKVNQTLKDTVTKEYSRLFNDPELKEFKGEDKFFFSENFYVWVVHNLIMIVRESRNFAEWAAHGCDQLESFFIDASSGILYQPLAFFKKDAPLTQIVTKFVYPEEWEYKTCRFDNNFILTDTYIVVHLNHGFPDDGRFVGRIFKLPYALFEKWIDKDGAMYKAFSGTEKIYTNCASNPTFE
ncbi:MAG: hypothetical protein WCW33_03165 [Candidatus Babeliales bacterium]